MKRDAEALATQHIALDSHANPEPHDAELIDKKKRKRKIEEEKVTNQIYLFNHEFFYIQPKTPQEIQKEMFKWARRQEKIKMSFKQVTGSNDAEQIVASVASKVGSTDINSGRNESSTLEPIKVLALEKILVVFGIQCIYFAGQLIIIINYLIKDHFINQSEVHSIGEKNG